MKVNLEKLFNKMWVDYNEENKTLFNNWWSFSEIKKWEEFLIKWFEEDKKFFFNLQNGNDD